MSATPLQKVKEAIVIATIWLVAVASPAMVADQANRPGLVFWTALSIGYAILAYDAVGAWRAGNRSPVVLRMVIPAVLLAASLLMLRAGAWNGIVAQLRAGS